MDFGDSDDDEDYKEERKPIGKPSLGNIKNASKHSEDE